MAVTVRKGGRFELRSEFNGLTYELVDTQSHLSVFTQGDDALALEELLWSYEAARPLQDTSDILAAMWSEYADLASPVADLV